MSRVFLSIITCIFIGVSNAHSYDFSKLSQLDWLAGHWVGTQAGVQMEEAWLPAKGNILLGLHRDVTGNKKAFFEFLRIEKNDEGVFYYASPKGKLPTEFKMIEVEKRKVVFENLTHDFPQRIIYWLDSDGKLHAKISGVVKGKEKAMEWVWEKK